MKKEPLGFKILFMTNMPIIVSLILKYKDKNYIFSFIFHKREKKEEFVLKYPKDQFPPNNSIEIEICDTTPDNLKIQNHHAVHISTSKMAPREHYVCHYPGANHDEALEIAKFWARYNVMHTETGSVSTEESDIFKFEKLGSATILWPTHLS